MYFGTPPPGGKFNSGNSGNTPVNQDIHWRARIVREKQLEKSMAGRGKPSHVKESFIKRPWTQMELNQLHDAVLKHGVNNWDVLCRDRAFLEMISNHTKEDIANRWKGLEADRKKRKPKTLTTMQLLKESSMSLDHKRNPEPHHELRLKATLQAENDKREKLARRLAREREALLKAEKDIAIQMREKDRIRQQLEEYEKLMRSNKSTGNLLSPNQQRSSRPSRRDREEQLQRSRSGVLPKMRHNGDTSQRSEYSASQYDEQSVRSGYDYRSGRSGRSVYSTRTGATGRSEATDRRSYYSGVSHRSDRLTDLENTIRSKLTARSDALAAAEDTKRKARQMLDGLKRKEGSVASQRY